MTDFFNDGLLWHLHNDGGINKIGFLPRKKYADINAKAAWQLCNGGNGVIIAIIDKDFYYDNGTNTTHPQFNISKILSTYNAGLNNNTLISIPLQIDGYSVSDNRLSHGTCVAGFIFSKSDSNLGQGVAYNSNVLFIQCIDNEFNEDFSDDNQIKSINHALLNNASIINMSFGDATEEIISEELYQAVEASCIYGRNGRGVIYVNAVDNTNRIARLNLKFYLKVGVSTSNDQFSFSAYGQHLDFIAPGQALVSENIQLPSNNSDPLLINYSRVHKAPVSPTTTFTFNEDNYLFGIDGASFATPIVSGICALILEVNPNLTWIEVRKILRETAHPIDINNTVSIFKWKDLNNNDIVDSNGNLYIVSGNTQITTDVINDSNPNIGETSFQVSSISGFSEKQTVLIGSQTNLVSITNSTEIIVDDASSFFVNQRITIGTKNAGTSVQTYFVKYGWKSRLIDSTESVFATPQNKLRLRNNTGFIAGQKVSLTGRKRNDKNLESPDFNVILSENLIIQNVDSDGHTITFTTPRQNEYEEMASLEVIGIQENLIISGISGNTITLSTPISDITAHPVGSRVELTGSEIVQIKSINTATNTITINKMQQDISLSAQQNSVTIKGGYVPFRTDVHGYGRVDAYQAVKEAKRLYDNAQLGIFDYDLIIRDNINDTGNNLFSGAVDSPDIAVSHSSTIPNITGTVLEHTEPIANKNRYVHVQVKNNGIKPCLDGEVRLFIKVVTAGSSPTFVFPADWQNFKNLDEIPTAIDGDLFFFNEDIKEINEGEILAGANKIYTFKWPKKYIPKRDGNFDTYLMAMITPFDGLKAGAQIEDNNNITYKKVTIQDYILFKDSLGGPLLNTQVNLSAYSAAQTIPFAIEINSPTSFDFGNIELTIKQKNRKVTDETITFKNIGGVWKFDGATPSWVSFSVTPSTTSGTATNFVGSYKITPEQKYVEISVKAYDSTVNPVVDFDDKHRLKIAVTDLAEIEDTSKGGSKMHFYTNVDSALLLQTPSQAFGPFTDPAKPTKDLFRITNLHSATADPKVYSVCDGLVCAQEIDASLVNLIVKPFQQPAINFAPIKYIIYKGVKRSSLFSGNDIAPSATNSLTKTIWDSHLFLKASIDQKIADMTAAGAPAGSIPTPLPANPTKSALGLDLSATLDATKYGNDKAIENLFLKADANFQYPIIRGGWDIGDFDKTSFGVEIVFENIGYKPTLNKVRVLENIIELDKITGTEIEIVKLENKLAHEEILNYMDAAAFFGSMYSNRVFIITSLSANTTSNSFTQKNAKEIYDELIKLKFLNKNRTYIDIRNEHSYSFNFYSNYNNSIRIGFDGNSPVNPINYYDNDYGWPLLIIDNSKFSPTNSFAKKIEISLPVANITSSGQIENEFPLAYISQGFNDIARGTILKGKNRFIEMNALIENGTLISNYTKESIKLQVPNGSTNSTEVVASYIRLKYLKRFDTNITNTPAASSGIVLRAQSYLDNLFIPVNMQIPYNSTNNLNSVVFDEEVYIDATNSDVNFDCIAKIGLAEDANNNVTLFAFATDVRIRNKDQASSKFAISGESNGQDLDYLAQLANQNPGIIASKKELTIMSNAVPYISLLDEISGDESFDKVDPDDFFSLVITKAQFDNIILIASDANNFAQNFKVYLAIANKTNGNDDNGIPYTQFDLVLRGYKLFSTDYQIVELAVTPTITIYSNGNI